MTVFLESAMRGLGSGSVYALIAVGFVIIFRSTGVLNFAQPALMVSGAVAVSFLVAPIGFFPAVILGALLIAVLALGIERVAIRPMIGRPTFIVVIITLGIDIILRVVVNALLGREVRQVGDPWGLDAVTVAGVSVQHRHLAMMITAAVLIGGLQFFVRTSRLGLAMRVVAIDQETALAQGISVALVFATSWALAGALAAVAGVFIATTAGITQATWLIGLKALPAIIIGGLDSVGGALIGGLAVGAAEALVGTYQPSLAPALGSTFALISPYLLMLLVLLIRPNGLFGTREVTRV